jgi:hypothetical protein
MIRGKAKARALGKLTPFPGAEASIDFAAFSALLKSFPFTKPRHDRVFPRPVKLPLSPESVSTIAVPEGFLTTGQSDIDRAFEY